MESTVERDTMSVVIRAPFNPAVFSPMWLLHHSIVGDTEYAETELDVISANFTQFRVEWLALTATTDTLQLSTTDAAEFERLRDAAVSISRLLRDVPYLVMGVTRSVHFSVTDFARWHALGDLLAPKDPWSDVLNLPGMQNLTIYGIRPDSLSGRIAVQVEPSARIEPGIYVSVNEHFDLSEVDSQPQTRQEFGRKTREKARAVEESVAEDRYDEGAAKRRLAIKILEKDWGVMFDRSTAVIQRVQRLAQRSGT